MSSQLSSHSPLTAPYSDEVSSDDEIIWDVTDVDLSLSSKSLSTNSTFPTSDDDFVCLRPHDTGLTTPKTINQSSYYTEDILVSRLSRLVINDFPTGRGRGRGRGRSRDHRNGPSHKLGPRFGFRFDGSHVPTSHSRGTPASLNPGHGPSPRFDGSQVPTSHGLSGTRSRGRGTCTREPLRTAQAEWQRTAPTTNALQGVSMDKKKRLPSFIQRNTRMLSPNTSPNHDPLSTTRPVPKFKSRKPMRQRSAPRSRAAAVSTGLGFRPIVDDISENTSENGDGTEVTTVHEEAAKYVTSFLTNPDSTKFCHLTLLQSIIIELGLTHSPISSLKEAKALLRSRAFLNIHDYLAVREQGQEALQRVMYPSKTALIKDIRTKGNPASLKWVKENGLQVFLVSCFA